MANSFEFKSLPDVITIPQRKTRDKVVSILNKLSEWDQTMRLMKTASDKAKVELTKLQEELGMQGFKFESLCFIAREMPGRKTLDKILLIENGVSPEVIEQSLKVGKTFTERRFKDLNAKDEDD